MKNRMTALLLIGVLLFSACACTAPKSVNKTPVDTEKASDPQSSDTASDYPFYADTESMVSFYELVKDNPIDDRARTQELPDDLTTQDLLELEDEITHLWELELEATCQEFLQLLTEEQRAAFESNQTIWREQMQTENDFVRAIFMDDKYNVLPGTLFSLERCQEIQGKIRDRTLLIKYWQYMLTNEETVSWRLIDEENTED